MIKSSFLILTIACLAVGCATVNTPTDPVLGSWDYELHNIPEGEPLGTMVVTKSDEGYTIMISNGTSEIPLQDAAITGNKLIAGYFNYRQYQVEVTGIFEAGTFTGQIKVGRDVFKMTGTRNE